jgi:hypothetical protein
MEWKAAETSQNQSGRWPHGVADGLGETPSTWPQPSTDRGSGQLRWGWLSLAEAGIEHAELGLAL